VKGTTVQPTCMYLCTYACTHICIYLYVLVCMYLCMHVLIYAFMCACTYLIVHIVYASIHVCIYMCCMPVGNLTMPFSGKFESTGKEVVVSCYRVVFQKIHRNPQSEQPALWTRLKQNNTTYIITCCTLFSHSVLAAGLYRAELS
jgi:hypothetical protein